MANPAVTVDFIANTAGLSKGMSKIGGAAGGLTSKLGGLAKIGGVVAGAAGIGALAATLKIGFDEMAEGQKIAAQTAAVLKSTGGAANVSAGQVDKLATAIMNKSGMDDEAVKSGENLLLTFTNIKNEAGKGNDIFNQTTSIMADMSVALGQSTTTSALQLGKALNDPIKGVTALQRVGVTFTEAQKKTIAAMVKAGNTAGAQKVILAELTKEFGGSAEAAGNTLPGKLNILKQNFSNLAGDIATTLVPVLSDLVGWLVDHWPQIQAAVSKAINQVIIPALKAMAGFIKDEVIPRVKEVVNWIVDHWPQISKVAQTAFGALETAVKTALGVLKTAFDFFKKNPDVLVAIAAAIGVLVAAWVTYTAVQKTVTAVTKIAAATQAALNAVMAANPIGLIVVAIALLVGALVLLYTRNETARKIIQGAWEGIQDIVKTVIDWIVNTGIPLFTAAFDAIKPVIEAVVGLVKSQIETMQHIIAAVMALIKGDWGKAWDEIKAAVSTAISGIVTFVRNLAGQLLPLAKQAGQAIVNGIKNELTDLPGQVWDLVKLIGPKLVSFGTTITGWGTTLAKTLASAATTELKALPGQIWDAVKAIGPFLLGVGTTIAGWGTDLAKKIGSAAVKEIGNLPSDLWNAIKGIGSFLLDKGKDIAKWGSDLAGKIKDGVTEGLKNLPGTIADAIGTAIRAVVNGVIDTVNRLLEFQIHVPGGGHLGIPSHIDINPPDIPHLASGGVFSQPTLALVGEGSGREVVAPESMLRKIMAEAQGDVHVRVFIGDQELRGIVRTEVADSNRGIARTLIAGSV